MKKILIAFLLIFAILLTSCNIGKTPDGTGDGGASGGGASCSGDAHADADNNGYCDACNEYVIVTLDFYTINDLHGKLEDSDSQPGVDELTSYLEARKSADDHAIFLSAGDMWQGGPASNATKGQIITEWMNSVGFEAMALGNHEFDWGESQIEANSNVADFPLLAINIFDNDTGKRVDYCESSVMIERGGAKIGIIGAIGDCYDSISSEMTEGVTFKTGNDLTALVKAESTKLREAGADMIVYLIHDGTTYNNLRANGYYDESLSRNGYVDLVFGGHTHSYYVFNDNYGVPHLQGGGDNTYGMSHVELNLNFANGNVVYNTTDNIRHSEYANLPDSPIVQQLLDKHWDDIGWIYENLGYNSEFRDSTAIGNTVAKLYYEAGVAKWGSQYEIVLAGGSINTRSPYNLEVGYVKYSDLQMILTFNNPLYLCSIKGSDLLTKFLNNDDYRIYSKINASDVVADKTYYIVCDSWTALYDWAKCTTIALYDNETFARDLFADYIKNGGLGDDPADSPNNITVSEAITLGESFNNTAFSQEKYYVTGTVAEIADTSYGNMYITDSSGNRLYVYGTFSADGETRYGSLSSKPAVGDTVTLWGVIGKYNNAAQMKSGWIISFEPQSNSGGGNNSGNNGGNTGGNTDDNIVNDPAYLTIAEAIALGQTKDHNVFSTEKYYVRGTVTEIYNTEYGNMRVSDSQGNILTIYGSYSADGSTRFDSMSSKPSVGDTITLYGAIGQFNGTSQMKNGWIITFGSGSSSGGNNGGSTTGDPYANMSASQFYANYTPATSYMDAYYRTQHGFMSGSINTQYEEPTLSSYRPMQNGLYVRNDSALYSDDGNTYYVLDAYGEVAFEIYKSGAYVTLEEVAAYVFAFGTIPPNYDSNKNNKDPEGSIWGAYLRLNHSEFSNDVSRFPDQPELPNTVRYYEIDIGTYGYNNGYSITRGAARIVYARYDANGNAIIEADEKFVFYTYNHYSDFQEYLNYEGGWGERFGYDTGYGTVTPYVQTARKYFATSATAASIENLTIYYVDTRMLYYMQCA